MLKHIF